MKTNKIILIGILLLAAASNATAMVHADGRVEATYEYSPYGEVLESTGYYATKNPFRFSTKYTDSETGLSYFGYRYYNPETGRWLNRDPIEEKGGVNLYEYVKNSPIDGIDALGYGIYDYLASVGVCIEKTSQALWENARELAVATGCALSCPIPKGQSLSDIEVQSAARKLNSILMRIGLNTGKWGARVCKFAGRAAGPYALIGEGAINAAIEGYCFSTGYKDY